jgi:signal transduction histidine kinase
VVEQVHPDYREIVEERIRLIREGKPAQLRELKVVKLDGTVIDVEVAAVPFTYQEMPAAQVVIRDISDRKTAEEELHKALEKERELSELKSRIITTISHEYRTPLTTILSSAELLENYEHKFSKEKKLTHLQRIQTSTRHLTNLVNDVMFVGQAELGRLEFNPAPLDLEQFCQKLVEELSTGMQNQTTLTSNIRGNCTNACLDEKLLRQILTNLLSNAIKYSPDGGTVRFDLKCADGLADFCIQDSGIGIPEEDLPQLFESFHRASNVGTIPGTGLGLGIVKKCVDLHGGQISVNSMVGVGTTFTVTLPLNYPVTTPRSS